MMPLNDMIMLAASLIPVFTSEMLPNASNTRVNPELID